MRTHSLPLSQLVLPEAARRIGGLAIRPIGAADANMLQAFGEHLSAQSRYQRFLSPRGFLPGEVERLTRIDSRREFALIATARTPKGVIMIGVARYVVTARGECEFAVVIADDWQKLGLGAQLLVLLEQHAIARGLQVMHGTVLATNFGMRRLAQRLGYQVMREPGDATLVGVVKHLGMTH